MRITKHLVVFCLLATTASAGQGLEALEEEFKLFQAEDITITASKKEEKVTEAPATVSVLTREEIRRLPALSVPDLLRYVPGVESYWAYESFPIVGMRGFTDESNNQVLLLIDGRETNNEVFGAPMWSLLPVSLDEIERIEVVRGPGSTLYGPNAFSGVINIITRSASEEKRHVFWLRTIEGASPFMARNAIGYSGRGRRVTFTVAGHVNTAMDVLNTTRADLLSGSGRLRVSGSPAENVNINFDIGGAAGKFIYIFPFSPAFAKGKHAFARIQGDAHGAYFQFFWNRYSTELKVFYDKNNRESQTTLFTLGVNTLDIEMRYGRNFGDVASVTVGGELRFNLYRNEGLIPAYEAINETRYGIFAQGDVKPFKGFKITLGVRYDDSTYLNEQPSDTVSPRVAFIYTRGSHTVRLSGARAFRRPSFLEYGGDIEGWDGSVGGEVEIQQFNEVINSAEIAYMGRFGKWVKTETSIFCEYFQNIIYFDYAQDAFQYSNLENNFYSMGAEASVDVLVMHNLSFSANYAFQVIRARSDVPSPEQGANIYNKGDDITSSPRHKINVGVHYSPVEGLSVDLFFTYYSRRTWPRYTLFAVAGGANTGPRSAGPNYLLNAHIEYEVVKGFSMGVMIRNALGGMFSAEDDRSRMYPYTGSGLTTERVTMYYGGEPMPWTAAGYLRLEI